MEDVQPDSHLSTASEIAHNALPESMAPEPPSVDGGAVAAALKPPLIASLLALCMRQCWMWRTMCMYQVTGAINELCSLYVSGTRFALP